MKQIRRYLVVLCLFAAISLYGLTVYPHSPVRSSGGSLEPSSVGVIRHQIGHRMESEARNVVSVPYTGSRIFGVV